MKKHFFESVELLKSNIVLIASIVLTIYLPLNILSNYLDYYVFSENEFLKSLKTYYLLDSIFCPVTIGALICVLNAAKTKSSVTYQKAMSVGLRNWFNLFTARLIAGLFVLLGFVALIVPGFILLVSYSLIDSVVILENAGQFQARTRSRQLTEGCRWVIIGECGVMTILLLFFVALTILPCIFIEALDNIYYSVFTDCIIDLLSSLIGILLFLFYWEAKEKEINSLGQPAVAADSVPSPQI